MGERKVVSKYLPPDFDPSLVPRSKKPKDGLVSVRMMLPFSIQCTNCSTFMYQGRKFNSKKENVRGEKATYLGIQRFRFYIKCTSCAQPISFLTDPQNADYEMESGATRNYELHRDKRETEESAAQEQEDLESKDPLKGLEGRVLASQREMEDMDNLEDIKAMNMRHVKLLNASGTFDVDAVLEARARNKQQLESLQIEEDVDGDFNEDGLTEQDEELVKSIQFGQPVKRLNESDELLEEEKRKRQVAMMFEKQSVGQQREEHGGSTDDTIRPKFIVKRRRKLIHAKKEEEPKPSSEGFSSLLRGYGSDSDSD